MVSRCLHPLPHCAGNLSFPAQIMPCCSGGRCDGAAATCGVRRLAGPAVPAALDPWHRPACEARCGNGGCEGLADEQRQV